MLQSEHETLSSQFRTAFDDAATVTATTLEIGSGDRIPCKLSVKGGGLVHLWLGQVEGSLFKLDCLILAYPPFGKDANSAASSSIVLACNNPIALEAAQATVRRFAQKYKRPFMLAYPEFPCAAPSENVFMQIEAAIKGLLDNLL